MSQSRTRVANLNVAFGAGTSELLNRVAQLSVLYEDLRLETTVLFHEARLVQGGVEVQDPFKVLYYLRRSLISLNEYRGALSELTRTAEFKRRKHFLRQRNTNDICEAVRYFQTNGKLFKDLRNRFGGHVEIGFAELATANFHPEELGTVTWWTNVNGPWSLRLGFASSVITAGLKGALTQKEQEDGQQHDAWLEEFLRAVHVVSKGYTHALAATYALISGFVWDKFA